MKFVDEICLETSALICVDLRYKPCFFPNTMKLRHIFISPGHNFFGHHGRAPDGHPEVSVEEVECVAGRGLKGDRFFDFKANYKGQVTFFAREVYDDLRGRFPAADRPPSVFRRNLITEGVDLNTLIGREFEVQGVRFEGMAECSPCEWMDQAFHPGAEAALKGRGGLRARILTDGVLHVEA